MEVKFKTQNHLLGFRKMVTSFEDEGNAITIILKDEELFVPRIMFYFMGNYFRKLVSESPLCTHIIVPDIHSDTFEKFFELSFEGATTCSSSYQEQELKHLAFGILRLSEKQSTENTMDEDDESDEERNFQSKFKIVADDRLTCKFCQQIFTRPNNCRRHEGYCTKNKERSENQQCELCPLTFQTKNGLQTHLRNKHKGEQIHSCLKCGKKFKNNSDLKRHCYANNHQLPLDESSESSSELNTGLRQECPTCHLQIYKSKYNDHLKTHSVNVFECQEKGCKFTSERKDNLKRHRELKHNIHEINTRPLTKVVKKKTNCSYECPLCSKKFFSHQEIENHMRFQKCENHYCNICGKKFSLKDNLKKHLKKFHA